MSDPVGYIALTVLGPDSATALAWLRRTQGWEHRLEQLRDPAPETPEHQSQPPSAA